MSDKKRPKPRAFDVSSSSPEETGQQTRQVKPKAINIEDVTLSDEVIDQLDRSVEPETKKSTGIRWLSILLSALGLLLSLTLGVAIDTLIRDLFTRHEWLGWFGLGLTVIIVLAILAIILREISALMRLKQINNLRTQAENAYQKNDKKPAENIEVEVLALYATRADMAAGRAALSAHKDDIIDGRGRILLIERELLNHLDKRANKLVMNSAKRVAIVTAVSPRALIDIVYVLAENLRLIRALSELYGGRPGGIGFIRLTRKVLSHLAVTGAISIGDGLVQQVVGHSIAARLSARFSEGVVNGLLTARIGLAAHDICRPIPFLATKRPSISVYMNALIGLDGKKDTA